MKNIKLKALPICDDRYIKSKIRKFSDKVYTNFGGLNVPEDDVECKSFTVISIYSLLVYDKKYYLQVYLENGAYKILNKKWQIILMKIFLKIRYYKCCITIKLIQATELILLKVIKVENAWFVTIGFLIIDSNFKIIYAIIVMIWQCCVLI